MTAKVYLGKAHYQCQISSPDTAGDILNRVLDSWLQTTVEQSFPCAIAKHCRCGSACLLKAITATRVVSEMLYNPSGDREISTLISYSASPLSQGNSQPYVSVSFVLDQR